MLQLLMRLKVTTYKHGESGPQLILECPPRQLFACSPERHEGSGQLSMMGIRQVCFDVVYDIVLTRSATDHSSSDLPVLGGDVRRIFRHNGRNLPEGVYGLNTLPGCRLTHFGGTWRLHVG